MTDIPALDAAVVEANAKVAEIVAKHLAAENGETWWIALRALNDRRTAALAARAAADRPKPLSAEEACARTAWAALPVTLKNVQAVLTACRERDLKVVLHEVGKLDRSVHPRDSEDTATVNAAAVESAVRSALLPPNPLTGG